jgi:hypothetical protein
VSSEERTPIDRPLTRDDLNDVRAAMHNVSQQTLEMYNEFRGIRSQFRTYVAICVASSFLSVVSAVIVLIAAHR